jgi:hypothetical protein
LTLSKQNTSQATHDENTYNKNKDQYTFHPNVSKARVNIKTK